MEQEFDWEYVVVEFIKDKSLAVIPKTWVQKIMLPILHIERTKGGKCR